MIKRILNIAVPNSIESGLFQISKIILSSIVAVFGTTQIAANGVAQSFWSMAALFCIAMGPAYVTVIGQCMGKGDKEAADYYMKKLTKLTFIGAFVWNILFFAVTPLILNLYSLSDEAIRLVIILCLIHNTGNIICSPFVISNGLRAAGDIKFTMYAAIFTTCIVRVVLSYLLGITCNLGVIGIALAMVADWAVRVVLLTRRYQSGKWLSYSVI